jgi:hypothetical protein
MAVIQDSPAFGLVRIGGTPTAAGRFTLTLRLTDALGTILDRPFNPRAPRRSSATLAGVTRTTTLTVNPRADHAAPAVQRAFRAQSMHSTDSGENRRRAGAIGPPQASQVP